MRLSLYEMDRRHGLKVARQEGIEEGKEEAILQVTSYSSNSNCQKNESLLI